MIGNVFSVAQFVRASILYEKLITSAGYIKSNINLKFLKFFSFFIAGSPKISANSLDDIRQRFSYLFPNQHFSLIFSRTAKAEHILSYDPYAAYMSDHNRDLLP
jgi:hypothetical protein